ncbi:hypothetical protein BCR42DRAFT_401293 [Absidia repens]|uniref:Uncharacterized protein n=1 Tax=Absidia repens TaxID=90262 RepID=A0A1X2J2C8_9FUNG|nr:hypothetical protein BCR42DRAFT_401293 [Absidia repens]
MNDTKTNKGILKKGLNTNISTQASSSSWLTRIQSKIFTAQPDDGNLQLQRRDLKRVTFSMGYLTTEHLHHNDILDNEDKKRTESCCSTFESTDFADYSFSLPHCYEKACRLREEKEWPLFMNMLQTHCSIPLTTIDLSNHSIGHSSLGPLADIFLLDFGLRNLRLTNCGLDDESVGMLLNSLLIVDSVVELDLSHNPLKLKGFKLLSIYIVESRSINSLNVAGISPDRRATQYLAQALLHTPSLQHLNMDQCTLKSTHLETIANSVCRSPSLTSISLRYNRFSSGSPPSLAALILNDHQQVDMDWNYYNETSIRKYGDFHGHPIDPSGGLQRLDLSGNSLQASSLGSFCQAMYSNLTLKHLSLANCHICPKGCEIIADALYTNQHLTNLDLSGNPIINDSDEGIHALKTALLRNGTLQELILKNTGLNTTATIMLAEVLPMNSALTRLDFSENPSITLAGILALSISIKMNGTLTFLDISIPSNDTELSDLQNDIAAVCTTNMIQRIERQRQEEKRKYQKRKQQQQQQEGTYGTLDGAAAPLSSIVLSTSLSPSSSSITSMLPQTPTSEKSTELDFKITTPSTSSPLSSPVTSTCPSD